MFRQILHDGWQLSATAGPVPAHIAGTAVPAQVPGSAHLDLLAAGLIPDPYLDRAEQDLTWAHRTECRYSRTFDAAPLVDRHRCSGAPNLRARRYSLDPDRRRSAGDDRGGLRSGPQSAVGVELRLRPSAEH